jgi:hypothetical protein
VFLDQMAQFGVVTTLARVCHDSHLNKTRARLTLSRRHGSSPLRVYPLLVRRSGSRFKVGSDPAIGIVSV